jgi:chromate transporter
MSREKKAKVKVPAKEQWELFLVFLELGATTFGGGYAMIPQIREQIVEKRAWLTDDELLEVTAIAESTPGPMSINLATYVGYKKGGFSGSILATLGVVIPSLVVIYLVTLIFNQFISNQWVAYAFVGVKAAVAFLICDAAIGLIKKMKRDPLQISVLVIITITMILFDVFSIDFSAIYLILIGGLLGLSVYSLLDLFHYLKSQKSKDGPGENK